MKLRIFLLLALTAAFATGSQADPLTFANVGAFQSNGTTIVDLYSNQGETLFGPQITFRVEILGTLPPGGADTLFVRYSDAAGNVIDQSFAIPLFGTIQPPFFVIFSVTAPAVNFQGVPATLFVDLLNSSPDFILPSGPGAGGQVNSFTYSFNVAQPVPEPTSILLLTTAVFGLFAKRRF
ncbi:MAG: PEP-CTERM sorting domain-containing protein [Pyrinomonadaceae bacterium]